MRHRAAYRHARHQPGRTGWPYLVTLLAVLGMLVTALALTAPSSPARAQAAPVTVLADRGAGQSAGQDTFTQDQAQLRVLRARLDAARARAALAAATYTVRPGDSLSRVAQGRCGTARDWTGIYAASRARHWTAANANVLAIGQHLFLACAWRPSMLRFAPAPAPPPPPRPVILAAATLRSASPATSTTYRTPVYRTPATSTTYRTPVYRTRSATPAAYRPSSRGSYGNVSASSYGTYSYAGLEALWVSAGGPAWAASHAAEIATCESGGRTSAYNPSGATGLWQILGSVVPGNLYNAQVNALNAVSKFRSSGDTFSQWVCR